MKILTAINTALIGILVVLFLFSTSSANILGGVTGYSSINLTPQNDDTYALAVNGTTIIATSGSVTAGTLTATTFKLGASGTTFDFIGCSAVTTWNPASVTPTSTATRDVAVPGMVVGDQLTAQLATTTQGLQISTFGTSTATATVTLSQPDTDAAAGIDIATTTVQVCAYSPS